MSRVTWYVLTSPFCSDGQEICHLGAGAPPPSPPARQEIPCNLRNQMPSTVSTCARHWSLSWARCIQSIHSSLGATALREPWLPVQFASTGPCPELFFSVLPSPSLVGPLERHLASPYTDTIFIYQCTLSVYLGLLCDPFASSFIVCCVHFFPCVPHALPISLDLIILIRGKEYKSWNHSLPACHQVAVTSSLLGPNLRPSAPVRSEPTCYETSSVCDGPIDWSTDWLIENPPKNWNKNELETKLSWTSQTTFHGRVA
jgi:hypothetical protein